MAANFYSSSSSNPVDQFGLGNKLINDQMIPPFPSNTNMNHMNENGLINSQLLPNSHPTPQFYSNGLISQRISPPRSILSQVGLSQLVTEVRRTYVSPHRVRIHSIINCSLMPNQSTLSSNEALISSGVVKTTRFVCATSTKERFLAPTYDALNQGLVLNNRAQALGQVANNINIARLRGLIANDIIHINQSQPSFRNQNLFSPNHLNYRLTEIKPFLNSIIQKMAVNQNGFSATNLDDGLTDQANWFINPNQMISHASQSKGVYNPRNSYQDQNSWIISNLDHCQNPRQMSNPSDEQMTMQISNPCPDQMNQHEKDDGRTHSLPYKKYGPYICPKCEGVFNISQTFAAHMWSHYKHESNAERDKRLAARYKKKNLRLAKSQEGLTMVSDPSKKGVIKPMYRRKKSQRAKAKSINVRVGDDEEQLQGVTKEFSFEVGESSNNSLAMVKEEPFEETSDVVSEVKIKMEPV